VLIGTVPAAGPIRISGNDRYATAVAAAQVAFPGWTGVQHVVIVSGETQVDALSAAGLAGAYNAPLLMTQTNSLSTVTRNAIAAMPAGVRVHIVGGTPSVSSSVANALTNIASVGAVGRTSGSDRYATAAAVGARMKLLLGAAFPTSAFIVNGESAGSMYDALVASPASYNKDMAILLVRATSVPAATSGAITSLGITRKFIVGGTPSVSSGVATSLGVPAGDRISGSDRYATAVAFAARARTETWLTYGKVGIASAIPDGLAGGAMLGKLGGPMLLTNATTLSTPTRNFLIANKASITQAYVFGSTSSVSTTVFNAIATALQ
jgi:N-acetylmuramoyl-L-alanine amidase